jgi:hypothetical protein
MIEKVTMHSYTINIYFFHHLTNRKYEVMRPPGAVITLLKCVRRLLMDAGIAVTARISAKLRILANFRCP